jgi:hypothetical protein
MTSISLSSALTIRPALAADAAAIAWLAELDSAPVPTGSLLLASVDDRPVVALSLDTGAVVADPFTPTAELVAMLRDRAERINRAAIGHEPAGVASRWLGRARHARRSYAA